MRRPHLGQRLPTADRSEVNLMELNINAADGDDNYDLSAKVQHALQELEVLDMNIVYSKEKLNMIYSPLHRACQEYLMKQCLPDIVYMSSFRLENVR